MLVLFVEKWVVVEVIFIVFVVWVVDCFLMCVCVCICNGWFVYIVLIGGLMGGVVLVVIVEDLCSVEIDWLFVYFWWGDECFVLWDDFDWNLLQLCYVLLDCILVFVENVYEVFGLEIGLIFDELVFVYVVEFVCFSIVEYFWLLFVVCFFGVGLDGYIVLFFLDCDEVIVMDVVVFVVWDFFKFFLECVMFICLVLNFLKWVWFVFIGVDKVFVFGLVFVGVSYFSVFVVGVKGCKCMVFFVDEVVVFEVFFDFIDQVY